MRQYMKRCSVDAAVMAAVSLTATLLSTASALASARVPPWGVNLQYIDRSVNPGDDFYAHANGGWLKGAQIPPDRSSSGSWLEIIQRNDERLREIVAGLHSEQTLDAERQKLRDLYDAYMDSTGIESNDLGPARKDLARIASLATLEDVARAMGNPAWRLDGPFHMVIVVDDKNPSAYAVRIEQSGLGLPDRDYYLKEDKALAATRDAYNGYLRRMLEFAGVSDASARAGAVYALERQLAEVSWSNTENRESEKIYNPTPIPALSRLAPGYPWKAHFEAAGITPRSPKGDRVVIVSENTAFPKLAQVFQKTPVSVWRDYLTIQYLHQFADFLPKRIDDVNFAMYGTTLQGRLEQQDRPTRGVRLLDRRMGEALGKIYVQRYFPPESKAKVQQMVKNLIQACREDLDRSTWMADPTRRQAKDKLDKFLVKIGYPDQWRDYSALQIDRASLLGSIQNTNAFDWSRRVKRIDEPVDRGEWFMSPPTVNGYYEQLTNEIAFPAGILQPPFFDPEADDAVNYGGIGCTIGHEISHGFDDQGSKYDGDGVLRMWWTEADRKVYEQRTAALAAQYDKYEPLPGLHVNGKLTLGENVGDVAGVQMSLKAYHLSLGGKEPPVLDGYTGDQRFYLAYAQYWRGKWTEPALRQRVLSNPHSPSEYRVNGVLRNDDGWYAAFPDVKPGSRYYLPPEQRIKLW
jgi:predicted metalloendopeptidase